MTYVDSALNITNFILRDLPSSRTGIRLAEASVQLAGLYEMTQVLGLDIQKLGKAAKTYDAIIYIPKCVGSVETFINACKKCDATKKTDSFVRILFSTIKVVGDGAASIRFFVGMGMPFYVGKTHLMYIKNICSIVTAGKLIYDGCIKTPANDIEEERQDDFRKEVVWEVLSIGPSFWLNSMGVLVEWIGPNAFKESGYSSVPKASWPLMGMQASAATAVKEYHQQD
ncbi:MAG: hypothetical protein KDK71_10230 [Chlamydiia bacterium]|nr:hypothetical protein [Chlamydiia bacterium]